MYAKENIPFDTLKKYFHLPLDNVANEFGLCITILKRICRNEGIPRWPHRKLESLDNAIHSWEKNEDHKDPLFLKYKQDCILELKKKKQEIMDHPAVLGSKTNPNVEYKLKAIHRDLKKKHPRKKELQKKRLISERKSDIEVLAFQPPSNVLEDFSLSVHLYPLDFTKSPHSPFLEKKNDTKMIPPFPIWFQDEFKKRFG